MTTSTWKQSPLTTLFSDPSNWSDGAPGPADTAAFGASILTNISVDDGYEPVGEWLFNLGSSQYNFTIPYGATLAFVGAGIRIDAGAAHVIDFGDIQFLGSSTAGAATFDNYLFLAFAASSTAGGATIHTFGGGGHLIFAGNGTGGSAQLVTDAGGVVDFSQSAGADGLGRVTAGSIAGAGTYNLGADQLTVGGNGLSRMVSGPINDGGIGVGTGASLVKVGHGTLKLAHAHNTYSGGTTLKGGALDLAAVGAAGIGAIAFAAGAQKLMVENPAMPGHVFANLIEFFGKGDVLDLTGLRFHAGAMATFHAASHHLTVHSGGVTDTLTLLHPSATHFAATADGHGGTDVFLLYA